MRLRSRGGTARVVLLPFLLAATDFELLDDQQAAPAVEPVGLLQALPAEVLERARRWERHIVEVVTGRAPDAPDAAPPRAGYDPASSTVKDRDAAKAVELTASGQPTSARTVTRMRLRYAEHGLWGLADQRVTRGSDRAGRADETEQHAAHHTIAQDYRHATLDRRSLQGHVTDTCC